jgi:hypothetical protein
LLLLLLLLLLELLHCCLLRCTAALHAAHCTHTHIPSSPSPFSRTRTHPEFPCPLSFWLLAALCALRRKQGAKRGGAAWSPTLLEGGGADRGLGGARMGRMWARTCQCQQPQQRACEKYFS